MTNQEMRELDAWIAEHVFGFKWGHFGFVKNGLPDFEHEPIYLLPPSRFDGSTHSGHGREFPRDKVADWKTKGLDTLIPHYTTDPAASDALEDAILKKLDKEGCGLAAVLRPNECWLLAYFKGQTLNARHTDKKICRALFAKQLFK